MRVSTAAHVLQKRRGRAMPLERRRLPAANEGGGGGGGEAAVISSALSRRRSGRPVAEQLLAASSSSSNGRASSIPARSGRDEVGRYPSARGGSGIRGTILEARPGSLEHSSRLDLEGGVYLQTCTNLPVPCMGTRAATRAAMSGFGSRWWSRLTHPYTRM